MTGYQAQPRRSGMTTAGKWMFIIGLVLSLLAAGAAAWGISRTVEFAKRMDADSLSLTSPQTVAMEQTDSRMVFSDGNDAVSCTVTLPDGSEQPLETPDAATRDALQDAEGAVVGSFTAQTAGDHTFACEGGEAMLAPNLSAGDLGGLAAAGLGMLALIPLGLLTLIGLILWLVGRSKDRRALMAPVGSSGYGYTGDSSSYGQAPGYPQQGYGGTAYPQQGSGGGTAYPQQRSGGSTAYPQQGYGSSQPSPGSYPPPPAGAGQQPTGSPYDTPRPGEGGQGDGRTDGR